MAVDKVPSAVAGQTDISMILNTLMYVDHFPHEPGDRPTVSELVARLDRNTDGFNYSKEEKEALAAVKLYLDEHPGSEVGSLRLVSYSEDSPEYKDALGAAFVSDDGDVYVAFRGTGDGRWYDNGDALAGVESPYQVQGAKYFDRVMAELGVTAGGHVYVTGHSKGGNIAQYITLFSEHSDLIDGCLSFDGEGFSPEAIEYLKKKYGEEEFNRRCRKLFGISGDNDFVNVLGICLIPEDQKTYVRTPTSVYDLPGAHKIENMYDYRKGGLHQTGSEQRELSRLTKSISDSVMKLPQGLRGDVCRTVMSAVEVFLNDGTGSRIVGRNGEHCTVWEGVATLFYADELVLDHLLSFEGAQFVFRSFEELERRRLGYKNADESPWIVDVICTVYAFFQTGRLETVALVLNVVKKWYDGIVAATGQLANAAAFVGEMIIEFAKQFRDLVSKRARAATQYCSAHHTIRLHTDDLRALAERLRLVNNRLGALDSRMDSLYKTARLTDLKALITAVSADMKICRSTRLKKCADYLDFTAGAFEEAEAAIAGELN